MNEGRRRSTIDRIPFASLDEIQRAVDVMPAIARVVHSGRYILGPEVERFERAFADYCGVGHCIGVANGTDALEIALRVLDVGHGGKVLLAANAGHYGSTAVRTVGAMPEYVDIDPGSMTMSVPALAQRLEDRSHAARPSAVIVTHLYGQLAETRAIVGTASRYGIPVIEDCAQAHGAQREGARAGAEGAIGCYSFYPTKNLGAIGDGGAVITNDDALAARARALRQYGWVGKYHVQMAGGRNSRLDEIQAAVLHDRLRYLDAWNEDRRGVAQRYVQALRTAPLVMPVSTGEDYVAHLFVVRVRDRNGFRLALADMAIDTEIHYPVADHMQPAFSRSASHDPLPHTEDACAQVVSLPCYPGLEPRSQDRVIAAIAAFLSTSGA